MTRPRVLPVLTRLIIALLTALVSGGALLVALGPAHAADATGEPKAGECRALTYKQMQTPTDKSDVVPCKQSHTAYTFAVPAFPNGTDLATESQDNLIADAAKACAKAATPYFRGSHVRQDMALWSWAYFIPTTPQLAAGADWIECDVVVVWPGKRLMPMPKMRKPLYAATEPKVALACHTAKQAVVPCTEKHQWRPVGGFNVKQTGYPSKAKIMTYGQRCHTITGTSQYLVSWPQKQAWKAGDHAIVCSKPTTT